MGAPRARPTVLVSDLDGTLLREDGRLSARTVTVLREVAADGVRLVFATARPAWSARSVLGAALGMGAVLVSSNGAVVSELDSGRTLRVRAMAPRAVRAALARLGPGAVWAVDRERDRLLGPGWPDDVLADRPAGTGTVTVLPDGQGILCLMVHGAAGQAAGLLDGVVWTSSGAGLVEISAPGADKVSAVGSVLDAVGTGWPFVLAFGDAPNDAALLKAAGTGVAVANACPEVLALADAVAPHHDDDGVAQWLAKCLPTPPTCSTSTAC